MANGAAVKRSPTVEDCRRAWRQVLRRRPFVQEVWGRPGVYAVGLSNGKAAHELVRGTLSELTSAARLRRLIQLVDQCETQ